MSFKIIGKGSQYAITYSDIEGNTFDGIKTHKVNVSADAPMKDFWSFTIYDNQTRSMLQTDEQFPGIDSNKKDWCRMKMVHMSFSLGLKHPLGWRIIGFKQCLVKVGIPFLGFTDP